MIGMNLQSELPGTVSYTVEHRGGCVLVFGGVPLSAFGTLTKLAPKKAVMDTQLARIAGCSMAMGLPEDTKALIAAMTQAATERARLSYAGTGLSEAAIVWLAVGERGASSDAMFFTLAGIKPLDMIGEESAHPHDADDLKRCRLLLEWVPELEEKLAAMAGASPIWARIVASWDVLCNTMDSESPRWHEGKGRAAQTYALLKRMTEPDAISD